MLDKTHKKVKEIEESMKEVVNVYTEDIKTLNEEIKELEIKKMNLEEVQKKIDVSMTMDPIELMVGQTKFCTNMATMLKKEDSFFYTMVTKQQRSCDADGNLKPFYIAKDGQVFIYILNLLQGEKENVPPSLKSQFNDHINFYTVSKSDILNYSQFKTIRQWIGDAELSELYKGSRDGFGAKKFHTACDGKGPTVTIIKTTAGDIFGGYSNDSWRSDSTYFGDNSCFLFSIRNGQPIKFEAVGSTNNVYGIAGSGPIFGEGNDIHISDQCNSNHSSYQRPKSYKDPTGQGLASSEYFTISEIEIFSLSS
ncbi:hypothetical protein PPL_02395 [Heterostelium album PN500]|uniref:TLDc domain-containing protein n=1 Tax=Heterostelium pallidum (strain ATCC 26659 / Pp 5 / PN500) TaxID=670386 RepID=D3AZL3_HETP5|nr:hypothetical protein PPL_02395 [Heterostelium album PN500]EFA85392.1 hypothetical protein PPL_02395 [Heterostelium album PN500]|eukprot:XP_020437501.1 hypothetical protein PPL_02395 [Heterostelium album PN500]